MICFCCKTENLPGIVKYGIAYSKCSKCGSIYTTQDIATVMQTDNDNAYERNSLPLNAERLRRIEKWLNRKPKDVLDFGCGYGFLMNFLTSQGITCAGINHDTSDMINYLPHNFFDAVCMIETIEHLDKPKETLELLFQSLKPDGVMLIETTFAEQVDSPLTNDYVDPRVGHINVISRYALEIITEHPTKMLIQTINPNVVCLWRP